MIFAAVKQPNNLKWKGGRSLIGQKTIAVKHLKSFKKTDETIPLVDSENRELKCAI